MTYDGYLAFGGNEVINSERARSYAEGADCPMFWLKGPRCTALQGAIGDSEYQYSEIESAPWYDSTIDEISRRFYGVYGLSIAGVEDSTRTADVTEGIGDGGVIGRARRSSRDVKVTALLVGKGQDALEYGQSWLSARLDPDGCGQLSQECGTAEASFFSTCPPERLDVPSFSDWVQVAQNVRANPSAETPTTAVEVRRNLIRYSNTTAVTGWTPTAGAQASVGGRLQFTANGGSAIRLGGITTIGSVQAAGPFTISFRAEALASLLAATGLGVRVYLYDSATSAIRANVSATVTAGDTKYEFAATATGAFDTVYMEFFATSGIVTGAIGYISEPLLEAGALQRPFFNGVQVPKLRRNLALNPRALNTTGWLSNSATTNPVVRGVTPPVLHPLGIETAAMQSSTGTNSALGTMYNLDSLANTGTPQRTMGAWVLVTEAGYSSYGVSLPVNQWVYVKNPTPFAAGAYSSFYVNKDTGFASTTVRVYITGAQVEDGPAPVGDFFDGLTSNFQNFATAWEGAANASASYLYDVDLSVSWSGAANASPPILTGLGVIGVTGTGVAAIRSSYIDPARGWPREGTYSLRLIPLATNNTSYALMAASANTPDRGTAIVHRMQNQVITGSLWAAAFGRIYWNPTPQIFSNQAPNEPGWSQLRVYSDPTPGTASTVILPHGGTLGSGDVWYDMMGIFPGPTPYEGWVFTGDSPSDDLNRYRWVGTPNASDSIYEVRQATTVPEADDVYNARVDLARRFMRNAGAISGPFKKSEKESNGFWMYEVQFVLNGGPAILGVTKALSLSPTLPSVVQDVPYNLIPYPSAELPEYAGAVTDWLGAVSPNGGTQLIIPTHVNPPGGQTTHPSVLDFGAGGSFGGYRYWMAHTPYPAGNDAHEDPNIAASNDGSTWTVPSGLTNPLDNQPGSPGAYNSDVELVVHPDGGLLLMWRTYNPATTGGEEQFWIRQSTNGTTWTPKVMVYQSAASVRRVMSPTLIWESGGWTMYGVDILTSPNRVLKFRHTGSTMTVAGWSAPVVCPVTLPAGRDPWHIQVRWIDGQYIGMLNDVTLDTSGLNGDLYVITSTDGVNFQRGTTVAIPRAGGTGVGHTANYRASLVQKAVDQLDVWFGGWVQTPTIIWNMFRTTLTAPRIAVGIPVMTNYSQNPSLEVNGTGWASSQDGVNITAAMLTAGRVTGELAAVGTGSFRVVFTATGAGTNGGFYAQQEVDLTGLAAGTRVSFNLWAAEVVMAGAPVRPDIEFIAYWRATAGGAVLRTDPLGTAPVNGGSVSLKNVLPPAGANFVLVRASARLTSWPAGTIVRLYADALAVTVP